jgi:hypothetical protein
MVTMATKGGHNGLITDNPSENAGLDRPDIDSRYSLHPPRDPLVRATGIAGRKQSVMSPFYPECPYL